MTVESLITENSGPSMSGADALLELIRNPDAYESKMTALSAKEAELSKLTGIVQTINEANALLAKAEKTLENAELNAAAIKARASDEIESEREKIKKSQKLHEVRKKALDNRESELNGVNAFVDERVKEVKEREQKCLQDQASADAKMEKAERLFAEYKERKAKLAAALKGV